MTYASIYHLAQGTASFFGGFRVLNHFKSNLSYITALSISRLTSGYP